jgi:hypothetical protein
MHDPQPAFSFDLVCSTFSDHFGLLIYSKRVNAEVELAVTEAAQTRRPCEGSRAPEEAHRRSRDGATEESEAVSPLNTKA